ncbi:MAG: efflux RND transporter permease subunit [Pseudomonadota bacterium]
MLTQLVRFSSRQGGVVVMLAGLAMAYAGYLISTAGLDVFPEFAPRQVVVQTEAPGLTAEQVERLVTQPIESASSGLTDLEELRSESIQGLSVITLVFAPHTDVYRNRQLVGERLVASADRLPDGVQAPVIVPLASSSATVMTIGLTSQTRSPMALRSLADWTVVPALLSTPGVADVNVFGGEERQLQVQVDPRALERFEVSLAEVQAAVERAVGVPAAGYLDNGQQEFALRLTGMPDTADRLRDLVLTRAEGGTLALSQVARVMEAPAPRISAAAILGEPAVIMMVIGQYGASTLEVTRALEQRLGELDPVLAQDDVVLHGDIFRPADYIERSLESILDHLAVGAVLVLVVLGAFLFDGRAALISAVAIPLSLIAAAAVLTGVGASINIMVLGGLAIALGEVVDDAIIDTENIFRRLRENASLAAPRSAADVIFRASMEVRGSVVYATFIVVLVFVPLLTLGGVAGRLFNPLGQAYILAVLVSLLVALTVTPGLCSVLLANARHLPTQAPPLVRWMQPYYAAVLRAVCRVPALAALFTAVLLAWALLTLPRLGATFLPPLREGHYIVHTASMPGTSLDESLRIGTALVSRFAQLPGVIKASQWAGRAERGADTYGSHYSEYDITLESDLSGAEQQELFDAVREVLNDFPGIVYEANTFLIERIDETVSGYTAPVVVNVYGTDLDELDRTAFAVAAQMREVQGGAEVQVRAPPGRPEFQVRLRPQALSDLGLRPQDVLDVVQVAFGGALVGRLFEGNQAFDLAVVLLPEARQRRSDLLALPLTTLDGRQIRLAEVAEVTQVTGRYNILHRATRRVQSITAQVVDRDQQGYVDELRERILEEVSLSPGTTIEFTGAAVAQSQARRELLVYGLLAGAGVLVLVLLALRSVQATALVLANVPFSLVGGVAAVLLDGSVLTVGSMVGFVTLFGITVRNSIMLLSHYRHLVTEEGAEWCLETAVRGAQERLPSILVTALVTGLAMLPIAIGSDNPGREIMGPMAVVIIGGLVSSTLLNLIVLPALAFRYGGLARWTDARA